MGNPLFSRFNQNSWIDCGSNFIPQPGQNPMNSMMWIMRRFNQFKNNFQGDPREQVQQLLNSGKMSQEQFNNLSAMASQFQNMLGR